MKYLINLLLIISLLCSCKSSGDYKVVRAEVVKEHDQVMIDNERANENKRRLDDMLLKMDSLKKLNPGLDTSFTKKEILRIGIKLSAADLEMEKWMKEFDAELGHKSNDEAVAYFENEKIKLRKLGASFSKALEESGIFIRKINSKEDLTKKR